MSITLKMETKKTVRIVIGCIIIVGGALFLMWAYIFIKPLTTILPSTFFSFQITGKADLRLFEHDKKVFMKEWGSSQGWRAKKTEVLQHLFKTYGIWISKYESDLKKVEEFLEKREEQRKKRIRKWGKLSPQVKEIEDDIKETIADLDVYKKKVDTLQFERKTLGELLEPILEQN